MRHPGGDERAEFPAAPLDVRLVPAALTSWTATAAGTVWPVGRLFALCCVMLAAVAGALLWYAARRRGRDARLRSISAGLVAIGVVGAGFGLAIALRADAVSRHPITAAFGTAVPVTVTPSESAVSLGAGRLMFRATLQRLRDDEISGRVVVFARASDFDPEDGSVMVGQPMRFTARISRPSRHDLTVAVLNATGRPTLAGPVRCSKPRTPSGAGSSPRFEVCCLPIRPRCCPPWFWVTPQRSPPKPAASSARRA